MLPTQNKTVTREKAIVLMAVSDFIKHGFIDGDIISLHWLKQALEIKEAQNLETVDAIQWDMLQKMEMFKSELLIKHQIALKNVRGEGYMIIPPGDQALYAAEEGIKAFNKGMKRTEKLLDNVRLSKMDNEEKRRHTDAQIKFSAIKGMLNKQRINVFSIFKDTKRLE